MDKLQPQDRKCAWCETEYITGRRRKYCSDTCDMMSLFFCFPQHPSAKAFILIELQGCACARCGLSYEDELQQKIDRRWRDQHTKPSYNSRWEPDDSPVSYFWCGYGTGDRLQVDHIIPLHKGGDGVGLHNVQVLCIDCHKEKTKEDL